MEDILVSVCCITYNHAAFIRQCLDGFLMQQTSFKIEILINDDASTDRTANIIQEYEARFPEIIKPIYQTSNQYSKGQRGMNIRYNFPRAKGKYIALCEGDDYWTDPLKLQKQVDFLEANFDYGLVYSKYIINNETEGTTQHHELAVYQENFSSFENYLYTGDMRTLTVMFRKSFSDDIFQLFDQKEVQNSPIGDRPMFLMIASKSRIKYFNEVFGVYRIHANESASRFHDKKKYKEFIIGCCEVNLFLNSYLEINNKKYRKWVNSILRYNKIVFNYSKRNYVKVVKLILLKFLSMDFRQKDFKRL